MKEERTLGVSTLEILLYFHLIAGYSLPNPPSFFTCLSPYSLELSVDTTSFRKFSATFKTGVESVIMKFIMPCFLYSITYGPLLLITLYYN